MSDKNIAIAANLECLANAMNSFKSSKTIKEHMIAAEFCRVVAKLIRSDMEDAKTDGEEIDETLKTRFEKLSAALESETAGL